MRPSLCSPIIWVGMGSCEFLSCSFQVYPSYSSRPYVRIGSWRTDTQSLINILLLCHNIRYPHTYTSCYISCLSVGYVTARLWISVNQLTFRNFSWKIISFFFQVEQHLNRFDLTWELHDKHLFHSIIFTDPVVQNCLPKAVENIRSVFVSK